MLITCLTPFFRLLLLFERRQYNTRMASEQTLIVEERKQKLRELYYLFSNPLQSLDDFKNNLKDGATAQFLQDNDISKNGSVVFKAIPGVSNYENLKREMTNAIQENLYGMTVGSKRTAEETEDLGPVKVRKSKTTDYPSRLMPAVANGKSKKTGVTSLKSQIDVLEEETNRFLDKNINDLEILSLPEHYPTEIHNVSSLAELYYLTQTLPLIKLLPGSHKTLMTENFELALLEGKVAVLYSRIEELKRQKKWSLRQPLRYYDPFVYSKKNRKSKQAHWDTLLQEAKWMATDFKEMSKFKRACCFEIAQAVRDYWTYGKVMCVKTRPVRHIDEMQIDTETGVSPEAAGTEVSAPLTGENDSTLNEPAELDIITTEPESEPKPTEPEIPEDIQDIDSSHDKSSEEEFHDPEPETIDISKLLERANPSDEIVPPSLPTFSKSDLEAIGVSPTNNSPFKTHINLKDLKMIDLSIILNLPKFTAFDDDIIGQQHPALKTGETSIVPVSRMLHPFDSDDDWYKVVLKDDTQAAAAKQPQGLPDFQKGLFGVQSHRRFNYLKPPKPPNVKNIKYRSPTIWLPLDDKYLIHYVAEYCFNWDLIAENLQMHSSTLRKYELNIERRTPWQCFERYIQLNEKFQFSDMKGHNAYQAQQWLEHAHKAQLTTKRRISPLGVGNESIQRGHRRLRWASMFDAVRKTMRRREAAAAKASHRRSTSTTDYGASATSGQGMNVSRASDRTPTPSELSKLKFDRDKTIQEAYMNQQATRSRMMSAVSLKAPSTAPGASPSDPAARRGSQVPGRPLMGSAAPRPGTMAMPASSPQTAAQGKLLLGNIKRPTTPNGTPYTVEQIQQLLQMQKQRRMMQQNQAGKGTVVPGAAAGVLPMQGAAVRKPTAPGSSYVGTSAGGLSSAMATGVKRPTPAPAKGRIQFAPAQVSAIINSIQQKNPNLTKEQVTKLAASYLANLQQQQQTRLEQAGRPVSSATTLAAAQARQLQLQRQKVQGKEMDAQTLSKMHYEERKKLMMQAAPQSALYSSSETSSSGMQRQSPSARSSPQYNAGRKKETQ